MASRDEKKAALQARVSALEAKAPQVAKKLADAKAALAALVAEDAARAAAAAAPPPPAK